MRTDTEGLHISPTSTKQSELVANGWPRNVGTEFDGMSVLRWIGERSFVMEFLAREIKPERLVALTVLKADFAADAEMLARFEREAHAAAHVVHPNVAAIYRVGKRKDGLPYIVKEYIGAHSLAELLRSLEVRSVDESTRTIISLAKALAAADAKGIVHGNVRPDNILVERDSGRIVLTNFGVSGQQEADAGLGDARYTSPEQLRGEASTAATDIFGLGVIAYDLLTGKVPEELGQRLRRCVDNNTDARPTAGELVRQLASDERTIAPLNLMQPTQRAAESFLMRVAVVSGLVIMAIGAAVAYWLYQHYSP
jgi:serine/threonine protein kinase